MALCPVGLADEFADKSVPLFCAVGWLGEFTHIDPSVGEVPPTRNDLPSTLQALAWSPDGILYAGAGNRNGLYKIDPRTGNAEYFLPTNVDIAGMAFSPSGELYVTGSSGARYLRTIDLTDGSSTSDRTLWGHRNSAQGLAFSPDGTLYAIKPNVFPGTYELLTIDLDDAQMHLLGSYSSTANVSQSITFTADGRLYAIGADAFAQLNPTDGSLIGPHVTLSGDYRGLAIVPPMVYYVDADANGLNDGSRWADAYNYLQDALAAAWSGDEIRVAQGTYKPDQEAGITPGDRTATFRLINGVIIKGGYAGEGQPDPNARDIELYDTILSGDLASNDIDVNEPWDLWDEPTRAENSYHVVTGSGTNPTAILDGFTITNGNAHRFVTQIDAGGGMYNEYGAPTVTNSTFIGNLAANGGAMYNYGSDPTLTNCTFSGNGAFRDGGGMYNVSSRPMLTNCTFNENSVYGHLNVDFGCGGGMYNLLANPILMNCTFSGNWAGGPSFYGLFGGCGGGMANWSSSPTLINCMFTGNMAEDDGGGMDNESASSPTMVNCTFKRNSAFNGGGMFNWVSSPTVTNCTFNGNSARYGGGMTNHWPCNPILTDCTFSGNSAEFGGGGMFNNESSNPILRDCTFTANSAGEGGGMFNMDFSNPILTNCKFSGNSADIHGGGIENSLAGTKLTNCTISGNSANQDGGGMYNYYQSNSMLTNCTFVGNSAHHGNALACDSYRQEYPSSTQVTNCILWDDGDEIWNDDDSTITITYSDVQGDWPGNGNIDTDPCFVELGYWDVNGVWVEGDYHLLSDSPCIDAGDPNYVAEPNETDLDGRPRVIGGRIDMGAYESPIPAKASIVPRTINLASKGKWITCYIWLHEDYNVADIDPNSILLEEEIEPDEYSVDQQKQVAVLRFSRSDVQEILNVGEVELTITGQLTDGTVFEGTDVIRVIDKGGKK